MRVWRCVEVCGDVWSESGVTMSDGTDGAAEKVSDRPKKKQRVNLAA